VQALFRQLSSSLYVLPHESGRFCRVATLDGGRNVLMLLDRGLSAAGQPDGLKREDAPKAGDKFLQVSRAGGFVDRTVPSGVEFGRVDANISRLNGLPEEGVFYAVGTLLTQIERATGLERKRIKIEAQVESAGGLVNVDATVRASDRLGGVHFGPGDFAASLRMPQTSIGTMDEWDEAYPGHRFHYAMQRIVAAARAADLRAVDGPVADHRDEEGLRKSCLLARSLGYDGKWCIHPA
jgi:hypothetical protein